MQDVWAMQDGGETYPVSSYSIVPPRTGKLMLQLSLRNRNQICLEYCLFYPRLSYSSCDSAWEAFTDVNSLLPFQILSDAF